MGELLLFPSQKHYEQVENLPTLHKEKAISSLSFGSKTALQPFYEVEARVLFTIHKNKKRKQESMAYAN